MTKQQRIEYLAVTSAAFAMGTILYTVVGFVASRGQDGFPFPPVLAGILGGVVLGGITSGIILAARFFSKKSLAFKAAAAFLWPVTLLCVMATVYAYAPYAIYNLVKICRDRA